MKTSSEFVAEIIDLANMPIRAHGPYRDIVNNLLIVSLVAQVPDNAENLLKNKQKPFVQQS